MAAPWLSGNRIVRVRLVMIVDIRVRMAVIFFVNPAAHHHKAKRPEDRAFCLLLVLRLGY
jgi:hypothetical protein